mmetsp:Transcript_102266/g.229633  ORF Transcript_102266/g.229633 Transcript_102266/m.229633 type:complete len:333 (+) Transcript_102266:615-1613(+)
MVTQPSLPSLLVFALIRERPLTPSSVGPSRISNVSPCSSLLIAFPSVMSKAVVITMLALQTSIFWASKFGVPCASLSATQPTFLSWPARPLRRRFSMGGSFSGPSRTSKTSPDCALKASALLLANSAVTDTSSSQQKYGLAHFSRKFVPWLPRTVTQPSLSSFSARHFTRGKPVASSTTGASTASTTSPAKSFRTVLLSLTWKEVVKEMSLTHLWYSCNSSERASLVTPAEKPSKPISSCMAFRPCSGIFLTNSRRASAEASSLPALSVAKRSSVLRPSFLKCACNEATTACSASPATCFLAPLRAPSCFLHLDSSAPTLTFSLTKELLASL